MDRRAFLAAGAVVAASFPVLREMLPPPHARKSKPPIGGTVSPTPGVTASSGGLPPGAPTNVAAAPDNTSAVIFFTPPKVTDGGANALSAITSYTATSSPGGFIGTGTKSGEVTVSGLTNGTAYTFTVTATNSRGTGAASVASNSVTPNARIVITAPTDGTNAASAINTAISGAAVGRAVFLPAGTYSLTTGTNVVLKAGVRFFGAGDTTILTGIANVNAANDGWIDHIKLTCGNTNTVAMRGTTATGVHVENCTFRSYGTTVGFGIWLNGDGTNRGAGWTIRCNDLNCGASDQYATACYFKPADNVLFDQNIVTGPAGQNVLWWGGSGNTVSNNVISGGKTGVTFLHFRATQKTYADRGVSFNNTVFRNTITNIDEEGISFDVIGNLSTNVAALDNGNISSKGNGTNQIVFSGGSWSTAGTTDYPNYYACWMTGTNRGKTAKITAQSNGTMTLDTTGIDYSTVAVGDRVALGAPFIGNVVEQNDVTLKSGSGTVGIFLYGLCYNNVVKNNVATGSPTNDAIAIWSLAALVQSDINHSGTSGVAPTGYNTVDNNRTSGYDISAKVRDFGTGNEYLNYGNSLTRNMITASGAVRADWHVMATTGNVGDPGVAILNTAPGGTVLTHQT